MLRDTPTPPSSLRYFEESSGNAIIRLIKDIQLIDTLFYAVRIKNDPACKGSQKIVLYPLPLETNQSISNSGVTKIEKDLTT